MIISILICRLWKYEHDLLFQSMWSIDCKEESLWWYKLESCQDDGMVLTCENITTARNVLVRKNKRYIQSLWSSSFQLLWLLSAWWCRITHGLRLKSQRNQWRLLFLDQHLQLLDFWFSSQWYSCISYGGQNYEQSKRNHWQHLRKSRVDRKW